MAEFELAQINQAHLRAPIDDPQIADFVNQLDPVNALAERSPGFVWRLKTESGNATDIDAYGDPHIIVNMSVWASVKHLHNYVFESAHLDVLKRKKEWFLPPESAHLALWWIPKGHRPSVDEARERLACIDEHGVGAQAFTLGRHFPAPFCLSDSADASSPFRATTQRDAQEIIQLLTASGLLVDDLDATRWNHGPGAWSLCIRDSAGTLIAAAAMEPCGKDALLRSVVVAESARGSGLARSLVARIEQLASQREVEQLFLLTDTAAPLFRKLGYTKTSRSDVPATVAATAQFSQLCPDSAECLCKRL